MSELLLPVATFLRVFDTEPENEVLTLPELTAALRRFEVKIETAAKIEREVARIRHAEERLAAGAPPRGKFMGKLAKVMEQAKKADADPIAALHADAEHMVADAYKSAKRDLRLWSPALYRPGADKRGKSGVTHVSCLVLDYDDGTSIREASTTWSAWFHLVYTTWSHKPDHPRFRLVMPLLTPVPAEDWASVWSWAERHAHFTIDPSMKSPAATYALPAVPHREWPREAFSRPGAILDPVTERIIDRAPRLDLAPTRPPEGIPSAIRGEDPEKEYIDHLDPDAVYFAEDGWDEDLDWEADPELVLAAKRAAGVEEPPPPRAEPAVRAEARPQADSIHSTDADATTPDADPPRSNEPPPLATILANLQDAVEHLERAPAAGRARALDELLRLHAEGFLSADELAVARERVLADRVAGADPDVRYLVVDFDGVLHGYDSGWRGATAIADPPVEGAIAWLEEVSRHVPVAIRSVRNAAPGGIAAMQHWLRAAGLSEDALARIRFPLEEAEAFLTIDDRALDVETGFPTFDELGALRPWNKR
ncbi:MAG: hypothetical protein AB7S26_17215 [Sandaracinaceae bacterium]